MAKVPINYIVSNQKPTESRTSLALNSITSKLAKLQWDFREDNHLTKWKGDERYKKVMYSILNDKVLFQQYQNKLRQSDYLTSAGARVILVQFVEERLSTTSATETMSTRLEDFIESNASKKLNRSDATVKSTTSVETSTLTDPCLTPTQSCSSRSNHTSPLTITEYRYHNIACPMDNNIYEQEFSMYENISHTSSEENLSLPSLSDRREHVEDEHDDSSLDGSIESISENSMESNESRQSALSMGDASVVSILSITSRRSNTSNSTYDSIRMEI